MLLVSLFSLIILMDSSRARSQRAPSSLLRDDAILRGCAAMASPAALNHPADIELMWHGSIPLSR